MDPFFNVYLSLCTLFVMQLGKHGSNLTEEELETHTISAWKEGKAYMNGQIDGHGRPIPRHLICVSVYSSLLG